MVLAAGEPAGLQEAYRRLAAQTGKPSATLEDRGLALPDLAGSSAWLLGAPGWDGALARLLPAGVELTGETVTIDGQRFARAAHTLILALPHPHNPDEAIGLLLGNAAEPLPGIWRKLPHYGKYSYLVFEGTTNVAKGVWDVARSPLKVVWEEGS
jgi:hypothetical protein